MRTCPRLRFDCAVSLHLVTANALQHLCHTPNTENRVNSLQRRSLLRRELTLSNQVHRQVLASEQQGTSLTPLSQILKSNWQTQPAGRVVAQDGATRGNVRQARKVTSNRSPSRTAASKPQAT